MDLGVIGLGTIATAAVEGICGDIDSLTVSRRGAANAARLSSRQPGLRIAENAGVVEASDVVLLGLMPDVAAGILPELPFREGQSVISLMADAPAAQVSEWIAPARLSARVIPFPAIARGGSPVLAYGERAAPEHLWGARNTLFWLEHEADLARYLCAQAVLSPAVQMLATASDWIGPQVADAETAEQFLRVLVGSSLLDSHSSDLLKALDTPGGYNQRLRQHMEQAGLSRDLTAGLDKLQDG